MISNIVFFNFYNTLVEGFIAKGMHTVVWDRRDDHDQPVRPGIYVYKLITKEGSASRSMVVY